MKKLTYIINECSESYGMEFITDRTPQWTEEQYCRNRNCTMNLLSEESTDETIGTARKVNVNPFGDRWDNHPNAAKIRNKD